ncbi:microfibril-associated glycoprotein 4-like [Pecten maximus]|uniref:microfibril-associated glycoprotein 4-like n=1 Tax=Pecten maximus TaxID=6579 RepID=UPI0014589978|nr:microfibril-associated glycoprotein 4-like [Pecten maximus]
MFRFRKNSLLNLYLEKENETEHILVNHDPQEAFSLGFIMRLCSKNAEVAQRYKLWIFLAKRLGAVDHPSDCSQVNSAYCSGVFRITPSSGLNYDVFCDLDTENGSWTVFQNRQDGEVDFYRNWADYQKGFGDLNGNFWAGLDIIHQLTLKDSVLLIELVSWSGVVAYARYSEFSIASESSGYQLSVAGFSGNVTFDAMSYHNDRGFSTYDKNDRFCASRAFGGWWYRNCYDCNLNGPYKRDNGSDIYSSMVWLKFLPNRRYVPLMKTRMLVKPSDD